MKVNLLVEFNKEKYNRNYKSHVYKIKTDINYYKYPSKSIRKIQNYKLVHISAMYQINAKRKR